MISGVKLKKEKIYLPVDKGEKPDWNYMESFFYKFFEGLSKWIKNKEPVAKKVCSTYPAPYTKRWRGN